MFDFVNDDERIIFTSLSAIASCFCIGMVFLVFLAISPFVLRQLIAFWISRRKLQLAEAQESAIGRAELYDVFVSYSHKDEAAGLAVAEQLRQCQMRVFLSSSALAAGDDFSNQIKAALRDAAELWILASPRSLASEWVMTEWGAAWAMGKRVVPVLVDCTPADLPERLAALHSVPLAQLAKEVERLKERRKQNRSG